MCAYVTYITLLLLETSFLPKASKRIFSVMVFIGHSGGMNALGVGR